MDLLVTVVWNCQRVPSLALQEEEGILETRAMWQQSNGRGRLTLGGTLADVAVV